MGACMGECVCTHGTIQARTHAHAMLGQDVSSLALSCGRVECGVAACAHLGEASRDEPLRRIEVGADGWRGDAVGADAVSSTGAAASSVAAGGLTGGGRGAGGSGATLPWSSGS